MNQQLARKLNVFQRVQQFCNANTATLNTIPFAVELQTNLSNIITELRTLSQVKNTGKNTMRENTMQKRDLRDAIYQTLASINQTAQLIAFDLPRFDEKFQLRRKGKIEALLIEAKGFVQSAQGFQNEFVKYGMAVNFIEQLNTDITTLEQSINNQNLGRVTKTSADKQIEETIDRGMLTINRLDRVIKNAFANREAILSAWKITRQMERTTPTATLPPPAPPQPQASVQA
ncbi:MAG: hypothetical protein K1Y36_19500 [Blastocatellia bacterium]|nr:hypothetical protein [Blastocatellia bacterium]